jgi:single-strand DNA-binding protein
MFDAIGQNGSRMLLCGKGRAPMANLNKFYGIGNVTKAPEIKYTPKGTLIASFDLAMNRVYVSEDGTKKEEVVFARIECWGKLAETVEKYLEKGRQIFIEARLKLDSWDDRETGRKRSRLKLVAENIQFLGSKPETRQPDRPAAPPKHQPAPAKQFTPTSQTNEPDLSPF